VEVAESILLQFLLKDASESSRPQSQTQSNSKSCYCLSFLEFFDEESSFGSVDGVTVKDLIGRVIFGVVGCVARGDSRMRALRLWA
jgi:hypothetical protein